MPYIRYMQNQEKSLIHGLRQLLIHDLYSALPGLNPEYKIQSDEPVEPQPLSSEDEKKVKRQRRSRCNILKCTTKFDHPGSGKFNFMDKR